MISGKREDTPAGETEVGRVSGAEAGPPREATAQPPQTGHSTSRFTCVSDAERWPGTSTSFTHSFSLTRLKATSWTFSGVAYSRGQPKLRVKPVEVPGHGLVSDTHVNLEAWNAMWKSALGPIRNSCPTPPTSVMQPLYKAAAVRLDLGQINMQLLRIQILFYTRACLVYWNFGTLKMLVGSRQDESRTEKYLNPKQVRMWPRSGG